MGYFTILTAVPGFFLSSFFFMLLWSVIAPKINLAGIDYPMAMAYNCHTVAGLSPFSCRCG